MKTNRYHATISEIEWFLARFISFADTCYSLPLALWTIGTFLYKSFDVFPYVVITAATKRSGKTRLAELLSMMCKGPKQFGAMTSATVFHALDTPDPLTLFCDEAETLSSEAASSMRAILNMGYRQGQYVPRVVQGEVKEFPTYCPKVFVLIGDVADTLKDRSIIIRMRRAEPKERFIFEPVRAEGGRIRALIEAALKTGGADAINDVYMQHKGLTFLTDRDEELWTALFAIAQVFCPERIEELTRYAVDIATEKTQDAARYTDLLGQEKQVEQEEYAFRLLRDVHTLMSGHRQMDTKALHSALLDMNAAPWRKFRGDGLTIRNISDMLNPLGVSPVNLRIGPRSENVVRRGYKAADVEKAVKKHLSAV